MKLSLRTLLTIALPSVLATFAIACGDEGVDSDVGNFTEADICEAKRCSPGISSFGPSTGGSCKVNPDPQTADCSRDIDPAEFVCGCDGNTYPNECTARVMGINVVEGACGGSGLECAGAYRDDGDRCRLQNGRFAKAYCCPAEPEPEPEPEMADNACPGCSPGASSSGPSTGHVCKANPDPITSDCSRDLDLDKLVCGCDGNTYLNECSARVMGLSVAHNGACSGF